ncbi:MAG: NUDIX hydrolase [Marivibrio sp.]|uniref:NUDIX hydrolase n=1 Tax=Marivibrio sp. TaxID=2039719 RepID=UPI0032EF8E88
MIDQPVPGASAPAEPVTPRPAASLVLLRTPKAGPERAEVLMGRRPETARFMPGVFVFPGGALDPGDSAHGAALIGRDAAPPHLLRTAQADEAVGLIWSALRETWEETGLLIGAAAAAAAASATPPDCPAGAAYAEAGLAPGREALHYIARAVTPPISPIRFDTRFFMADAERAHGEAAASGELPEVLWVPVGEALASSKVRGVSKFVLRRALELAAEPALLRAPERPVPRYTYEGDARVVTDE